MSCLPTDQRKLWQRMLLGPNLKDFTKQEQRLLNQAMLCKPELQDDYPGPNPDLFKPTLPLPTQGLQTYSMWKAGLDLSWQLSKIKKKKKIYIQPIDAFPPFINDFMLQDGKSFWKILQNFMTIYFMGMECQVSEPFSLEDTDWNVCSRTHSLTGQPQLLASDIYKNLKSVLSHDGYCSLAVTWTDLYPSEELNFVLGEASMKDQGGVFSFGRFEPKIYRQGLVPPPIEKLDGALLWKLLKCMSHETCHIFGLNHCVFFNCAMNESTSTEQAMSQPFYLCPVCLRKLQKACKFDIRRRYKKLRDFLRNLHRQCPYDKFEETITWLNKCLQYLDDARGKYHDH